MNFEGKHYDRIVGENSSQENLDYLRLKIGSWEIKGFEKEKTERELEILAFAESCLDEYLEEFKKERRTKIPIENIHILKEGGVHEFDDEHSLALARPTNASILIDRMSNEAQFAVISFHEMIHLKSFLSQQYTEDIGVSEPRRSGISSFGSEKDKDIEGREIKIRYLGSLDESLTSFLERRFFDEKILNNLMFTDEDRNSVDFSYQNYVDFLNKIIDEIIEKSPEPITKDEIVSIMMDAKFNGSLLPLARIIKNSLGMNRMKELFEMDKKIL